MREMTQLGSHWARQNLLLQKNVQLTKGPVSKNTEGEVHSGFLSNASLPLTLTDQVSGSQLDNLKRRNMGQGTLGAGRAKIYLSNSCLKQTVFETRVPGNKRNLLS
jgi:hypothetical protein